jgi:phage terminase Nu1 subunit (DNA packaging protein)
MQSFAGVNDWGVPVAHLAQYLDLTERRVQQLVNEGVIPKPEAKLYRFLECVKGYNAYLQQCAAGKAVSDEAKEKQSAQIGLLQAQRDSAQMELDKKRGALIPADQVREGVVKLVRILSEGADGLPDMLERKAGMSGQALTIVSTVMDSWRMRLYEEATKLLGGEVIPDEPQPKKNKKKTVRSAPVVHTDTQLQALDEPDADLPQKRKPGRPRLVQKDQFTPSLI